MVNYQKNPAFFKILPALLRIQDNICNFAANFINMDHLTPQQRHKNMAAIHNKDTKLELIVRKGLWKRGFRYRLNHKRLPGHPDIVLRKYRTCIFVNGCFWHGHGS
jgi:hypothetical protein